MTERLEEREAQRVLVTGFGPFPGVPVNPSAALAEAGVRHLRQHGQVAAEAHILMTDWEAGPQGLVSALNEMRPTHLIMLGVSHRAATLCIETLARNAMESVDVSGRHPATERIEHGGADIRHSRWPSRQIVRTLRRSGIAAVRSRHAGHYLCNRVLYEALRHREDAASDLQCCGFVHIPQTLAVPAELAESIDNRLSESARAARPTALTWPQAVRAVAIIVTATLAKPAPADQRR